MPYSVILALSILVSLTLYRLVLFALRWRRQQILIRNHHCLPPVKLPQLDPFLGTDVVLRNLRAAREYGFLALLRSRHAAHGLTFTTNTYLRTTINTCDPNLLRHVLTIQFQDFGMGPLRRSSASPLLGKGIFTTDDEVWAHQRALIRPSFVTAKFSDFLEFSSHIDLALGVIKRSNYRVDLQQLFFRMVLDSNSAFMFGESIGLMDENSGESASTFHHALDYAQQGTILRLRLGNLMFAHYDKKFRNSCKIVHSYAQKYVDQALRYRCTNHISPSSERKPSAMLNKEEKVDHTPATFLEELAKETDDPTLLRDQIVNMLLAARDTTAGLLAFAFFMLARRPEEWEKTRANVLEHYCQPLTYAAVMRMTYLRYVLQETLRLFPPIATNSRMAKKDTVLPVGGGPDGKSPLFVAKHNVVTYSTFVMHRRPEFFGPDADSFRPQRWEHLRPGWEYLPFNGGPRICPGQKFALTEASYTVARLLKEFKGIVSLDESEWREQLTLSLTLNNGVPCVLIPDD